MANLEGQENQNKAVLSTYYIYTVHLSKNDFLKMDAPFWGGVDISVNAHAYTYVHLKSRSFFQVILSCKMESTMFN